MSAALEPTTQAWLPAKKRPDHAKAPRGMQYRQSAEMQEIRRRGVGHAPQVSGDMSKARQPERLLRGFAFGFVTLRCGRTEHHNQQDQRKNETHDRTLPNTPIMRLHALTRREALIH